MGFIFMEIWTRAGRHNAKKNEIIKQLEEKVIPLFHQII